MATHDDVRDVAKQLPGAIESEDRFGFSVMVKGKHKGFAWSWLERVDPKKAKVVNEQVLAITVPNLTVKDIHVNSGKPYLFTEPHYNGFPAVLVRLEGVPLDELADLLIEGWRAKAPADLVRAYDEQHS